MKKIRVAINGFGRIGRHAAKVMLQQHKQLQLVAINDLTDTKTMAHLFLHDTAYPEYPDPVTFDPTSLTIGKTMIFAFAEKDPTKLPWKKLKIDIVLECTGRFRDEMGAGMHVTAGAKAVVISAPAKDEHIKTYVMGVNERTYDGAPLMNNASCTTNCAAPVMKVLEETFGVEKAMLTTVHSYTATQPIQDGPAAKDLRETRAAAQNMVPTSTGAATATAQALPALKGKFDGLSVRVPTITVSLTDITAVLKKKVTIDQVNQSFIKASKGSLKGILAVTNEPLVSSDFIGDPHSAIVDLSLTNVVGGNLLKVIAWYDNEWGYANRLVEMAKVVGEKVLRKK